MFDLFASVILLFLQDATEDTVGHLPCQRGAFSFQALGHQYLRKLCYVNTKREQICTLKPPQPIAVRHDMSAPSLFNS